MLVQTNTMKSYLENGLFGSACESSYINELYMAFSAYMAMLPGQHGSYLHNNNYACCRTSSRAKESTS